MYKKSKKEVNMKKKTAHDMKLQMPQKQNKN